MTISIKKYILLLFAPLYLISCEENKSVDLLKQAQSLVTENPSKALTLLDSTKSPENMDEEDYMQYIVTYVQSRYNNDEDISNDTLIFDAQKYYNNRSNADKASIANFYSGTVYRAKKIHGKAVKSFLLADMYAQEAKNKRLRAKSLHFLGNLYLEQGVTDSAIVRLRQALNLYNEEADSDINRIHAMSSLGRSYDVINNLDSAFSYFQGSLGIANEIENTEQKAMQSYNLGYIYLRKMEYDNAKS